MSACSDSRGISDDEQIRVVEIPNGDSVTVRIIHGDDDRLRVENDSVWSFVEQHGAARLESGPRPLPMWLEPLLRRLGLDGVIR
jgi:hypothetical protein